MNHRTAALLVTVACGILALAIPAVRAEEFVLAEKGQAKIAIFAPGENEWAGRRLADRLLKLTGAQVEVETSAEPPASPPALIAIGTAQTNSLANAVLNADERVGGLGEEGYILKCGRWQDRPILAASGNSLAGVNNAVSELVSWKLKLREGGASVSGELSETDKPALPYRLIWKWDGQCNWATTMKEMIEISYEKENSFGATTVVPYTPEGFRTHFTRAIDYFSDHKLNGLIVWGFLRDEHGGVEMGREISRYGKRNNVRILPGVCSQAAYGGFIFSGTNKFNLDVWLKQHPELQARNEKGEVVPGMLNPMKPENQQWLREGAEWLFTNLPDIGGINLENGDFMSCYCEECQAERAKPENDPNCFWDMMVTQKPILEAAQRMRPDGWMTFASYCGFTEAEVRRVGKHSVYPPKFLNQVPGNAICQWTFTSMTTPESWPAGARPSPSACKAHIGLLHHGSFYGPLTDPARWWAKPGAWLDDYSTSVIPFVCERIAQAGLGGLALTGMTGVQCPSHELNYMALEYFGWHPERSYEQFMKDRLHLCYGGAERAESFLKLLRNTSKAPEEIDKDQRQAADMAQGQDLDVRQRARWRNLADELARRQDLAKSLAKRDGG